MTERLLDQVLAALSDPIGIDTTPFDVLLPAKVNDVAACNALGDLYGRVGDDMRAFVFYQRAAKLYQKDGYSTKAIAVLRKATRLPRVPASAFWELGDLYAAESFRAEASRQYLLFAEREDAKGATDNVLRAYERIIELEPRNGLMRLALGEIYRQCGFTDRALEQLRQAQALLDPRRHADDLRRVRERLAELEEKQDSETVLPAELELPIDEAQEVGEVEEVQAVEEVQEVEEGVDDQDAPPIEEEPRHEPLRRTSRPPDEEELTVVRGAIEEIELAEGEDEPLDVVENDFIRSVDEETPAPARDDADLELVDLEPDLVIDEEASGDDSAPKQPVFEEVVKDFKDAMSTLTEGDDPQGHYDLGIAYREMGMLDDAVAEFQAAARHESLRDRASCLLAECYLDRGQPEAAVRELRQALGAARDDEERLGLGYRLARTLIDLGRDDEALAQLRACYDLDAGYRDVAELIDRLEG